MNIDTHSCPAVHGPSLKLQSLALLLVVVLAVNARGSITLSAELPTYLPDANLVSYVLHAHSDNPAQLIVGVDTPNLTAGSTGMHQVWTDLIGETPTRGSQLAHGFLWNDAWLPYDSYWFFDNSNSVSAGAAFTESNTLSGGANVPSPGLFPPLTGFGSMSTVGNASGAIAYTAAGGKQGQDVALGQFVFRPGDQLHGTMTVFSDQGGSQFVNLAPILDDPIVFTTRTTLNVAQGQSVSQLLQAICPGIQFPRTPTLTWGNLQFTGPGVATQPQLDSTTHQFTWDTTGSVLGTYNASVVVYYAPGFPSTATLMINVVPEPACTALFGMAIVSFAARRRR